MYESVVCEHMPKTETARNKATINFGIKEVCWAKKFYFLKNGRPETENFFGVALCTIATYCSYFYLVFNIRLFC